MWKKKYRNKLVKFKPEGKSDKKSKERKRKKEEEKEEEEEEKEKQKLPIPAEFHRVWNWIEIGGRAGPLRSVCQGIGSRIHKTAGSNESFPGSALPRRSIKREKRRKRGALTCFLDFSSSQLKLLSSKAKNKLSTRKLPMTRAGRKTAKHVSGPCVHVTTNSNLLTRNAQLEPTLFLLRVNRDVCSTSILISSTYMIWSVVQNITK